MIALCIVLGLLLLLLLLPVGVCFRYDENGAVLSAIAGIIKIRLFPRAKKAAKVTKTSAQKKAPKAKNWHETKTAETPKTLGGKLKDFLPFIRLAASMAGDFRRRLVMRCCKIRVTVGGKDPADTAVAYGAAWAAVGTATPILQSAFRVKKQDVAVDCDFAAEGTTVTAELRVTIRVGQSLRLLLRYGVRFWKQWRIYKKGGNENESSGQ